MARPKCKWSSEPCIRPLHAELHAAARRVVDVSQVLESQFDEKPVEMPDPWSGYATQACSDPSRLT